MPYSIVMPQEKSYIGEEIRTSQLLGNPFSWFDNDLLTIKNLNKIQFDFFVNWKTNKLQSEIWLKRVYEVHTSERQTREVFKSNILKRKIFECDLQYFNTEKSIEFFCNNNLQPKYMIIKDLNNPKDFIVNGQEITNSIVTALPFEIEKVGDPQHLNLPSLKNKIRQLSGKPLTSGKPLRISTSALESYLYSTPDKWPGDCDLLLFDNDYNCKAIIEFKKHNIASNDIRDHSIQQYLNDSDARKYKRLGLLRDYFTSIQQTNIPLVVFIYPTYPNETNIKLEFLEGPWSNLKIKKNIVLAGPINQQNKINIIDHILRGA